MDLDAYSAAHRDEWARLDELGRQRDFTGAEADELIEHYQAGASQLSAIQTTVGESVPGDRLSLGLSRARLRFTSASASVLSRLPRFFLADLPAALYRVRWLTLAVAVAFIVLATLQAWWVATTPEALAMMGSRAELEAYREQFINYYSEYSGTSFTSFVWTNNAWLAAQAIGFGITGVFPAYLLLQNAIGIGGSAGALASIDSLDVFLLYIAPHGQLELYSVFLAAAAGFRVFWAWIAPGARTRAQALSEDGRAMFTIVVGLTLALLLSGLVEGLVTRQEWPWPIKIGIGTIALAVFLFYQWVIGGRAARAGQTGDLAEFEAGARQLVAG
ncbi:putative membrane protein SpoIIM required for sporulation [Microbacteriaceae bacterium SG_E_30_P1]|uniref:Membrane protein SpoIIM required for sporulation n=1 Tax=Antiquaquibacter oligotrophicus TaxID=2880260 RepID=A0ABT6KNU3_9MICO|nr:stage II sporulation protein M [Antiquaquibacter oligotrophicus]MDH6181666.1 putative membrane protein SpoIIM required for sporulation [Antiquaquibacter oligotrophicus]UDF12650.1 stage II sporulation protein M [Antiquaquibacter oligotrophicus]